MSDALDPEIVGLVYGIRLADSAEYRYVGMTESTAVRRFARHRANARAGRRTPFYDWLRKYDGGAVVDELELVRTTRQDLGLAEMRWIADLRGAGHRLLNLTDGGLGPSGVVWSDEQREAARVRSTGRKGVSRPGALNPFYGARHTAEQRARWSRDRAGTNAGEANPNYGKFGPEHPSYGHTMSEEARLALSEARKGAGNPNFGKSASAETRAKMSAARRGRPMPSSRRSAHTRYHTNKGAWSSRCEFCDSIIERQFALLVLQGDEKA
ncbi:NUMOD3 motif protein [Cellulomonas sp. DKR-3]|uniref:NUMOD3 motif protein n=1 Tax=Cellulomonas fulva TaxID=2835530 RepID=A0ABS5TXE8_9CELL|nr:NUMOD3 domain-containing DNA-binding protein [Cellulomonas fulva]MBT0993833.1 NUMOD3 motif protein [Cellulomonas fulva]